MDICKLNDKITEKGLSSLQVAEKIGMTPSTFYRKMKTDGMAFTVEDAAKLQAALGMDDNEAIQIFLKEEGQMEEAKQKEEGTIMVRLSEMISEDRRAQMIKEIEDKTGKKCVVLNYYVDHLFVV